MTVYLGIDEAGYGPTLGPMIITAAGVQTEGDISDSCELEPLLRRHSDFPSITDSKKIYTSGGSLAALEQLALHMAGHCSSEPISGSAQLIHTLTGESEDEIFRGSPWYTGDELPLPVSSSPLPVMHRECGEIDADVRICSRIINVSRYNRDLSTGLNKHLLVFVSVCTLVQRIISMYDDSRYDITVDRLGGRKYYRRYLMEQFPEWYIDTKREDGEISSYEMCSHAKGTRVIIRFAVRADGSHICTAAASIISKYLRELSMIRFNTFFRKKNPSLQKTSGYPADAERFLRDTVSLMKGIPRHAIIRQR